MPRSVSLTFSGETMVDVYAAMELELQRVRGNLARDPMVAAPAQGPVAHVQNPPQGAAAPIPAIPAGGAPSCPADGARMEYRAGGTVKAGPRIGQSYPPFWSCPTCKTTMEVSP